MSQQQFPTLFSPYQLGQHELKNRFLVSAHAISFDEHGLLNDLTVDYWVRRAAGGAGMIVCHGAALVHAETGPVHGRVSLWDERNDPYLERIAAGAHEHGAVILSQAAHRGRASGHKIAGYSDATGEAPSAIPALNGDVPRELTRAEIRRIVVSFGTCAARLERLGWDGMEVLALGGHLINQFWSPAANQRDDEYGGDFERRMRYSLEVFRAVRANVSDSFLIGCKIGADPLDKHDALTAGEMFEVAKRLDAEGIIDYFHVGAGTSRYETVPPDTQPIGTHLHFAKHFREHLSAPVSYSGRILDVAQAETALVDGDCDIVAMTRATIADPDLPNRAARGEVELARPCISLVDACIGRTHQGVGGADFPIRCGVNPAIGYAEPDLSPAADQHRVLVVGGGPGGMEAARVAAVRGHSVELHEASSRLGGQVATARKAPHRPHLGRHIDWLGRELRRLGVQVHLDSRLTAEDVRATAFDSVVVATGARTILPPTASPEDVAVTTDVDILEGRVQIERGSNVVVYDREGRLRGGMAAVIAAEAGANVTFATSWKSPMDDLDLVQQPFYLKRLASDGTSILVNKSFLETVAGGIVVRDLWSEQEDVVSADLVIFIGYRESAVELYRELTGETEDDGIRAVGDCITPRRYRDAVREGSRAGEAVGAAALTAAG